MSKKAISIGILVFSIIFITALTYGDQYYLQFAGNCFQPRFSSSIFYKASPGYIYHNDTNDEYYFCPVNFNLPDGSAHYIKSIGVRYLDNLTNGYLYVELRRLNLYSGNYHTVASWSSGLSETSLGIQTASQGTESGYKLAETKKFSYFLYVLFYSSGSSNPGSNLALHSIRVHVGT